MSGVIMHLENSGSVSFYMKDMLLSEGYEYLEANDTDGAQSIWDDQHDRIDCIILDLAMSFNGLSNEERMRTYNGLLTGWIWFTSNVLIDEEARHTWSNKTIIYTDYLTEFEAHVPYLQRQGFRVISKRDSSSPAKQMLKAIKEIIPSTGR